MASGAPNSSRIWSLRLLGQGCVGVLIGSLVALAVARLIWPPSGYPKLIPPEILPLNPEVVYFKPREKGFYLLTLILGSACGYLATFRILQSACASYVIWSLLLLSVPLSNFLIGATLGDDYGNWIAGVPVGAALIVTGVLAFQLFAHGQIPSSSNVDDKESSPSANFYPYLILLALLTLVLIPSSFSTVAARIGLNFHAVSFFFGPALYFLGHGLLPGIDYYTQYSIGMPWLFHFVMGSSAERAVFIYSTVAILATWLFYAHLIYLLRYLYRSWFSAGLVAFIPLILVFTYPQSYRGPLYAPSDTILRFPLLTVGALLACHWARLPNSLLWLTIAGIAAGLSIFLETESGVVITVAMVGTMMLVHPWQFRVLPPIVLFLLFVVSVFLICVAVAFGGGVLHLSFFRTMLASVTNIGVTGFGAVPTQWTLAEWKWLYNLVGPAVMLATLAVIGRVCGAPMVDRKRAAMLAFFAIAGLLLLVKYANRSLASVWQMSSICPFVVLGWWCLVAVRRIDPSMWRKRLKFDDGLVTLRLTFSLRNAVACVIVSLAALFLWSPLEARNPANYGLKAWAGYPSLLHGLVVGSGACAQMSCIRDLPAVSDIALIKERMKPGEQVAIVSDQFDWAYLLSSHRPPLISFLPSSMMFTTDQLDKMLGDLEAQRYLFTPKSPQGYPAFYGRDDIAHAVLPLLGTTFQRDGEGEKLIAWKRAIPRQSLDVH